MRILHVITSLRTGGAEKLMVDLLPRISKYGHQVDLLVFNGVHTPFMDSLKSKGINVYSLRVGNVYNIKNIFSVIPYLKQYDVVHTHNTACQFYVALACKLSSSKCVLVTTEHSTSNRRRSIKFFRTFDSWMYHSYKSIICVSDIAGNNIKEYIGDYCLKIATIPNGIDYEFFNSARPTNELKNNKLDCHCGVMVAGFRYEKDHPTVIKAYAQLPKKFHLFLVGDGERRTEFEALAKQLHCEERIHFLGVRSDVASILKESDVVIMSSHREGLSLSSLEGMASGKPFIASDVDGLQETVCGYGELFPHEDANALSALITHLADDMDYSKKIAEQCQIRAKQFDIAVMAKQYLDCYSSLINNS